MNDPLDDTGTPLPAPSNPAVAPQPLQPAQPSLPAPSLPSALQPERAAAAPLLGWPPLPQASSPLRRSLALAMDSALPVMLRRARQQELPLPTPWPSLNDALSGGLWPGFYTLTSGTGAGKTQWALHLALAAAQEELAAHDARRLELQRAGSTEPAPAPRPVVYVALELGEVDLCARLLSLLEVQARARAPRWSGLAYGHAGEEALVSLACKHQDTLQRLPLSLEVASPLGWHAEQLAELAAMQPTPRLVVLDYLQLVAHERHEDARSAMTRVAYQARALARDHGVVVLALSSTARANYASTRANDTAQPPWERDPGEFVGLGKESGDIEYAADGVFALLRQPSTNEAMPERMHLAVAKQRAGRTSWVRLLFDGSVFSEDTPAHPAPAPLPARPGSPPHAAYKFPDEE